MTDTKTQTTLVLGATGKTGRRVAQRLFSEVLDGRNARVADGVRRALGREPRDFAVYARDAGASGGWDAPAANGADQ